MYSLKELEKAFWEYHELHTGLVEKYMKKIIKFVPSKMDKAILRENMLKHDASKTIGDEHKGYLYINFSKLRKMKFTNPEIRKLMNEATIKHIMGNKHHPEYWDRNMNDNKFNFNDRDGIPNEVVEATSMPSMDIIEMCCDWCAVAEERNTCPFEWGHKNINKRWKFYLHQEKFIYKVLKLLLGKESGMNRVFLGGTYTSNWRDKIIPHLKMDYFNPIVDDWNKEQQIREDIEKIKCRYRLYVITPKMKGVYSIAEVVDDSCKYPKNTILTILDEDEGVRFDKQQKRSLDAVAKLVTKNKVMVFRDLESTVDYLNYVFEL